MAKNGLAARLYRGEADLNIVGRRNLWFGVAGVLVLIAVLSFAISGFKLGIEFAGGNTFQVPASVGTLDRAEQTVDEVLADEAPGVEVVSAQKVGSTSGEFYEMRTGQLSAEQANAAKAAMAQEFGIQADQISGSQVSEAWGSQVTSRAFLGLVIFIAVVSIYLVLRFEWRMAVAAIISLLTNLILTAGIYSLVGFEVTPSTIIGFLTILGFALYDVVVVFDKVQENTRGITANNNVTYGEASNLALNQSLMRSLNTSVVALLPVGGLLFIGADPVHRHHAARRGHAEGPRPGAVRRYGGGVPDLDPAGHAAAGAAEEHGPADQRAQQAGGRPPGRDRQGRDHAEGPAYRRTGRRRADRPGGGRAGRRRTQGGRPAGRQASQRRPRRASRRGRRQPARRQAPLTVGPDGIGPTASVMLDSRHDGRRRRFERTWDAP